MSKQLDELLFLIRQHPAFKEFMDTVNCPELRHFRPSESPDVQYADFIYRSGRRQQHELWRQFLIGDQQEKL